MDVKGWSRRKIQMFMKIVGGWDEEVLDERWILTLIVILLSYFKTRLIKTNSFRLKAVKDVKKFQEKWATKFKEIFFCYCSRYW